MTPAPRPVPSLELPLPRFHRGRSVAVSVALHAILIAAILLKVSAELGGRAGGRPGSPGGREAINFFTLPAAAPTAVAVPAPPTLPTTVLPALAHIKLDLPPLDLARDGPTTAGAPGAGAGAGAGASEGAGTGGGGDYIVVASPRTAILPPLAKVPGSVAGRSLRIRFWVAADGRVTRVEVDPPIREDAYRREFLERMMAYRFYPARTPDGANVASVVTVPMQLGN